MTHRAALIELIRAIAGGDTVTATQLLAAAPELARTSIEVGASRANPSEFFLDGIGHHVYAGDTALHVAAAAYLVPVCARAGRAGARSMPRIAAAGQPLHYAADGNPESARWNPPAQAEMITLPDHGAGPIRTPSDRRRHAAASGRPHAVRRRGPGPASKAGPTRTSRTRTGRPRSPWPTSPPAGAAPDQRSAKAQQAEIVALLEALRQARVERGHPAGETGPDLLRQLVGQDLVRVGLDAVDRRRSPPPPHRSSARSTARAMSVSM